MGRPWGETDGWAGHGVRQIVGRDRKVGIPPFKEKEATDIEGDRKVGIRPFKEKEATVQSPVHRN